MFFVPLYCEFSLIDYVITVYQISRTYSDMLSRVGVSERLCAPVIYFVFDDTVLTILIEW